MIHRAVAGRSTVLRASGQRARPGPGSQPALLTLRGCSGRDAPFLPFIAYPLDIRHRAGSLMCTPPLALLTKEGIVIPKFID